MASTETIITPRKGHLQPLRTRAEVASTLRLGEVTVVHVHSKDAHSVIKLVDGALSDRAGPSLAHLRRVARPSALSPTVLEKLQHRPSPGGTPALFVLAAPASMLSADDLSNLLSTMDFVATQQGGGASEASSVSSHRRRNRSSRSSRKRRATSSSQAGSAPMSRQASNQSDPNPHSQPMSREGSSRSTYQIQHSMPMSKSNSSKSISLGGLNSISMSREGSSKSGSGQGLQSLPMSRGSSSQSGSQQPFQSLPMSRGGSSQSGSNISNSVTSSRRGGSICNLQVLTISVPLKGPPTQDEAKLWSDEYWPVVYRASNPFGPQPTQWKRSAMAIEEKVGYYMGVAAALGAEAQEQGRGPGVGAVIAVSTSEEGVDDASIIAGASDARWLPPFAKPSPDVCAAEAQNLGKEACAGTVNGNPMAHAVMRAIGMVGRQRVTIALGEPHPTSPILHDAPLTLLEKSLTNGSQLTPAGYLCTGLDIYLTHEPCIECCMAILHSRFARVVFWKESMNGGMAAEFISRTSDAASGKTDTVSLRATTILGDLPTNLFATNNPAVALNEKVALPLARPEDDVQELADTLKYTRIDGAKIYHEADQAEDVGRYGLWHRVELNWRLMAWKWTDENDSLEQPGAFHA